MKRTTMFVALAAVAACSQAEPAPEPTEQSSLTETEAQVLAADGQPPVGNYKVTTSDGEVLMEELRADGTYTATKDGEVVETGKWVQKSPTEYCYTADEEGATEQCNTEGIDDRGVWTSRDPEGKVATVERVQT